MGCVLVGARLLGDDEFPFRKTELAYNRRTMTMAMPRPMRMMVLRRAPRLTKAI